MDADQGVKAVGNLVTAIMLPMLSAGMQASQIRIFLELLASLNNISLDDDNRTHLNSVISHQLAVLDGAGL